VYLWVVTVGLILFSPEKSYPSLLLSPSHTHLHTYKRTHTHTQHTHTHAQTHTFTFTHTAFVPVFFFYFASLSIWRFAQAAISPQSLSVFECVHLQSLCAIVVSVGGWGTEQKEKRKTANEKVKNMLYTFVGLKM